MKTRLLLLLLLTICAGASSFAQTTGTANLNITLTSVLSMSIATTEIPVNFDTETKYTNGITSTQNDHIVVVSSRPFTVKAVAGTITGTSSLTAGTVKITTAIGATNAGNATNDTYVTETALPESTPVAVVTSTNSSWDGGNSTNKFNVTYLIGANGAYANKTIASDNVIPVVYTITQQ